SKKQTLLITKEPAKKPAARKQPTDVQIRDTPGVSVSKKKAPAKAKRNKGIDLLFKAALLEETQMKKAIKRIKRETHMHQAGGSDNEASFQPEVPDKQKGKSIDTHKGTGLKPGVFVMSEANFSDSEYKSWGVSDDDDDDQQDNEQYDRINKEMYDDVNVELKDAKLVNEGKGDEEMTDADIVNVELKEVNQEVASAQVQDEAQATTTGAPAQVTSSSRSVSSNLLGIIEKQLSVVSAVRYIHFC
ncbi:hypothetical protein Tco_1517063, partial [Tanacetum coccineum]